MSWQTAVALGIVGIPLVLIAIASSLKKNKQDSEEGEESQQEHSIPRLILLGFALAGILAIPGVMIHIVDAYSIAATQSTALRDIYEGQHFILIWLPYLLLFYMIFVIIINAVNIFKERKQARENEI